MVHDAAFRNGARARTRGGVAARSRAGATLVIGGLLAGTALTGWGPESGEAAASPIESATVPAARAAKQPAARPLRVTATHLEPAVAGSTVTMSVVVADPRGEGGSQGWELRDHLPRGFSYVPGSARLSTATDSEELDPGVDGRVLSWRLPPLGGGREIGAEARIEFEAEVDAGLGPQQNLSNRVELRSRGAARSQGGAASSSIVRAQAVDRIAVMTRATVSIGQRVLGAPEEWVPDAEVSAELIVRNDGPSEVPGVVRVLVPEGLRDARLTAGEDWVCAPNDAEQDAVSCAFVGRGGGAFPVGVPLALELRGRIAEDARPGDRVESIARVRWLASDDGAAGSLPDLDESRATWTVVAPAPAVSDAGWIGADELSSRHDHGADREDGREALIDHESPAASGAEGLGIAHRGGGPASTDHPDAVQQADEVRADPAIALPLGASGALAVLGSLAVTGMDRGAPWVYGALGTLLMLLAGGGFLWLRHRRASRRTVTGES
ncbi:hypothetical protein JD292_08785 [Leucobacter sp. CSA2]|uniref:DUF11 domain-containing protein n=1 Tax=Leucobacter edaphi TaxID=2796472 RepID=A0A934QE80_9MICO|nr:hypothetical protein [Leucobacter edaphi]MBK0422170.1 hypothetical protein [Leucobacter edaphi]